MNGKKKLWQMCSMECSSAVKTNDIMKFTGKWIEVYLKKDHSE